MDQPRRRTRATGFSPGGPRALDISAPTRTTRRSTRTQQEARAAPYPDAAARTTRRGARSNSTAITSARTSHNTAAQVADHSSSEESQKPQRATRSQRSLRSQRSQTRSMSPQTTDNQEQESIQATLPSQAMTTAPATTNGNGRKRARADEIMAESNGNIENTPPTKVDDREPALKRTNTNTFIHSPRQIETAMLTPPELPPSPLANGEWAQALQWIPRPPRTGMGRRSEEYEQSVRASYAAGMLANNTSQIRSDDQTSEMPGHFTQDEPTEPPSDITSNSSSLSTELNIGLGVGEPIKVPEGTSVQSLADAQTVTTTQSQSLFDSADAPVHLRDVTEEKRAEERRSQLTFSNLAKLGSKKIIQKAPSEVDDDDDDVAEIMANIRRLRPKTNLNTPKQPAGASSGPRTFEWPQGSKAVFAVRESSEKMPSDENGHPSMPRHISHHAVLNSSAPNVTGAFSAPHVSVSSPANSHQIRVYSLTSQEEIDATAAFIQNMQQMPRKLTVPEVNGLFDGLKSTSKLQATLTSTRETQHALPASQPNFTPSPVIHRQRLQAPSHRNSLQTIESATQPSQPTSRNINRQVPQTPSRSNNHISFNHNNQPVETVDTDDALYTDEQAGLDEEVEPDQSNQPDDQVPTPASTQSRTWSEILSPMKLLRTPFNLFTRRNRQPPATEARPVNQRAINTPSVRRSLRVPATVAHTRQQQPSSSVGPTTPSRARRQVSAAELDHTEERSAADEGSPSKRVKLHHHRRADSHLPVQFRGARAEDLPSEWQDHPDNVRLRQMPVPEVIASPLRSQGETEDLSRGQVTPREYSRRLAVLKEQQEEELLAQLRKERLQREADAHEGRFPFRKTITLRRKREYVVFNGKGTYKLPEFDPDESSGDEEDYDADIIISKGVDGQRTARIVPSLSLGPSEKQVRLEEEAARLRKLREQAEVHKPRVPSSLREAQVASPSQTEVMRVEAVGAVSTSGSEVSVLVPGAVLPIAPEVAIEVDRALATGDMLLEDLIFQDFSALVPDQALSGALERRPALEAASFFGENEVDGEGSSDYEDEGMDGDDEEEEEEEEW